MESFSAVSPEFRRSVFVVLQLSFPGSLYSQVYISCLQKYVNALNIIPFSTLKFLLWAFDEELKAVE